MTDLVTFLRARLDEDEQAAHAAADETGPEWTDGGAHGESVSVVDSNDTVAVGPWTGYLPDAVRQHIARHHPAHVLAEVAAKRAIIDVHVDRAECTRCERFDDELYPCDTLKLLASVYADHPDYRKEWTP